MECEHDFREGPFYIMVARSYEEPDFYPPSSMFKVEHCVKCGLLRLPEPLRKYIGKNLSGLTLDAPDKVIGSAPQAESTPKNHPSN